jgi:histidinol-phosphatase (PHP family)
MIDYHIHTFHSIDAEGTIDEYCQRAIKLGLKEICITNHCELDPVRTDSLIRLSIEDDGQPLTKDGLITLKNEVIRAKELYKKNGLTVKLGLEVGYFDGIEPTLEKMISGINFDFLMGSIHCIDHICIDSSKEYEQYYARRSVPELLDNYFEQIRKLIESKLFDTVGHLDVYKKYGIGYYGDEIGNFPKDSVAEIFELMSRYEVGLEINTAGLRRVNEFYPSPSIMKFAQETGVKMVTIGSDCHRVTDLGKNIQDGLDYAESFGFETVYGFDQRKPTKIKI